MLKKLTTGMTWGLIMGLKVGPRDVKPEVKLGNHFLILICVSKDTEYKMRNHKQHQFAIISLIFCSWGEYI